MQDETLTQGSNLEADMFDAMSDGDIQTFLSSLKLEAAAAVQSGDIAMAKWGRSTGVFATLLLGFLTDDRATVQQPAPPVVPPVV